MNEQNETVCTECRHPTSPEELTEFENAMLCDCCLDALTILCRDCGERIYRSENEGTDEHPLCSACYDDYTTCERCGRLIHRDNAHYFDGDDYAYCSSCYENECNRSIQSYDYKPEPIFYGEGDRFFGVELEIDGAGEYDSSADKIMEIANRHHEHIYCKHDGSLSDGFEIVTHPMSLAYHMNEMPWSEVTSTAVNMRYLSHKAGSCGLHIHVGRTALGETYREQDAVIGRILYFVERNWNELLIFSRRTQSQLDRWAKRYGYKDKPQEMLEHAKSGYAGRYTCVNLTNCDTIEFRIFRGTLKTNTLLATLQMVDHICDVALFMSDDELRRLSWSRFMEMITEPELISYLKERRLYVNEAVSAEEDI